VSDRLTLGPCLPQNRRVFFVRQFWTLDQSPVAEPVAVAGEVARGLMLDPLAQKAGRPRPVNYSNNHELAGPARNSLCRLLRICAARTAWFEPGVEAAIAASILVAVAGLSSLLGRCGRSLILVTTAIGLGHGFGLSFSLRDLLAHRRAGYSAGSRGFQCRRGDRTAGHWALSVPAVQGAR
jgi:hypothetical protein